MQEVTLIQADKKDLEELLERVNGESRLKAFLNRFDNVFVGVPDIAKFHNVHEQTVRNYIKDGLIICDNDTESHPRFRMSYALNLDFKELRRRLKIK